MEQASDTHHLTSSVSPLSEQTQLSMINAIKWGRLAAIISFINLGLGVIQIVVGAIIGDMNLFSTFFSFLISAAITLVMSINLMNFSKNATAALETGNSSQLSQALYHLKIYFTVMGGLFLIILGLFLLLLLIAIIAAMIAFFTK